MSTLREIQQTMAAAVMQPLTGSDTMRRRSAASAGATIIKPNDRLTSFERLEIYNRQYWFRICASFEEDFPGLQAVVGRRNFERLMIAYLSEVPSTSFSLRNLGSRLESWLTEHPHFIEPRRDLALDMVRIEWAHIEAFDSAAEPPLTAEELASVTGESAFRLQPYLKLLQLRFPVDDLLIDIHDQGGSSDTASNNAVVVRRRKAVRQVSDLQPQEIFLAVHRFENTVHYRRLLKEDFLMVHALSAGMSLEEAITAGFAEGTIAEEMRPGFLQEAFQNWSSLGWFTGIATSQNTKDQNEHSTRCSDPQE